MKRLIFVIIYIILSENGVLSDYYSCPNGTESCYYLNELLAPCSYKIDFSNVFIESGAGLDSFPFPNCACSQDFYNNLVSCCISCNFPVDNPLKFESDCRIGKNPVNIDEEKVPKTPITPDTSNSPSTTPSNTPIKSTNNVQSSGKNSSSSIVGKVAGTINCKIRTIF
ncbi:hypothetical protein C1645_735064 [Glomus cerebriforme]|uniref:Uncharacterized protein n=1 Tax=Glomus cerebriforme TaxID=658196 RepID=A0A397TCL1_9GLOM|nr:hypothetical protein C1645_735064 [Glomus cerebriforme]